jgi:hypothetical protein
VLYFRTHFSFIGVKDGIWVRCLEFLRAGSLMSDIRYWIMYHLLDCILDVDERPYIECIPIVKIYT